MTFEWSVATPSAPAPAPDPAPTDPTPVATPQPDAGQLPATGGTSELPLVLLLGTAAVAALLVRRATTHDHS